MNRRGFTLIEVLVTLVIIAMFSSAVYSIFLKAVIDTRNSDEAKDASRRGLAILRIMAKDIECAVPSNEDIPYFVGSLTVQGGSRLELITTTNSREIRNDKTSDVIKVKYELVPSETKSGLFVLVRKEFYAGGRQNELEEDAWERILSDAIKEFSLEFLGNEGWVSAWNNPHLPKAVRIKFTIVKYIQSITKGTVKEKEFPFESIISIPGGTE